MKIRIEFGIRYFENENLYLKHKYLLESLDYEFDIETGQPLDKQTSQLEIANELIKLFNQYNSLCKQIFELNIYLENGNYIFELYIT